MKSRSRDGLAAKGLFVNNFPRQQLFLYYLLPAHQFQGLILAGLIIYHLSLLYISAFHHPTFTSSIIVSSMIIIELVKNIL